jgi:hypothetical protein
VRAAYAGAMPVPRRPPSLRPAPREDDPGTAERDSAIGLAEMVARAAEATRPAGPCAFCDGEDYGDGWRHDSACVARPR